MTLSCRATRLSQTTTTKTQTEKEKELRKKASWDTEEAKRSRSACHLSEEFPTSDPLLCVFSVLGISVLWRSLRVSPRAAALELQSVRSPPRSLTRGAGSCRCPPLARAHPQCLSSESPVDVTRIRWRYELGCFFWGGGGGEKYI